MIRVLFVCSGNICRSPMAEAVFRHLIVECGLDQQIDVDSAGIGSWHVGERPHSGTRAVLARNHIEVGGQRARQLTQTDLSNFDHILAMDSENVDDIQALFGRKVSRLLEFAPMGNPLDVPDPYYTGSFEHVYQLVLVGCQGLLAQIRQDKGL